MADVRVHTLMIEACAINLDLTPSSLAAMLGVHVSNVRKPPVTPRFDSGAGAEGVDIFICYSHADKKTRDELQIQLAALMRGSAIKIWDDSQIRPGMKWRNEIKRALSAARAAILLVSPDFLASDFVMNEEVPALLRAAEDEGVAIFCLILRPCLFDRFPTINQFQAFNSPNQPLSKLTKFQREMMFVSLAKTIDDALNP